MKKKMHREYNTNKIRKGRATLLMAALFVVVTVISYAICVAESEDLTCWILCQKDGKVYVRRDPTKASEMVGRLECGDEIRTDGRTRDGWIHVNGIGEYGEGWVYCGFVSLDEPERVNEQYVCVAKNRVACRRWMDGPQIGGRLGWLYNGTDVMVYFRTDEWCVTSRGYIRSEWLEVDPE